MPCPFANILGVPGEGVHAPRLFGLARNDTIATILAAAFIAHFWKTPFWKALLWLFIIGEVLHYIMGVDTAFLKMIGMSPTVECLI